MFMQFFYSIFMTLISLYLHNEIYGTNDGNNTYIYLFEYSKVIQKCIT